MNQPSLYDGLERKEHALDRIEMTNKDFIACMRAAARKISRERGKVCADDLREWAGNRLIVPQHQNAWGAIFRGSEWESIGFISSRHHGNHARVIRVWRLK